jgi:hypothetical protein
VVSLIDLAPHLKALMLANEKIFPVEIGKQQRLDEYGDDWLCEPPVITGNR